MIYYSQVGDVNFIGNKKPCQSLSLLLLAIAECIGDNRVDCQRRSLLIYPEELALSLHFSPDLVIALQLADDIRDHFKDIFIKIAVLLMKPSIN